MEEVSPPPRQLQHETKWGPGGPCRRCGLRYSTKTAYVPCFVELLRAELEGSRVCLDCGHSLTEADKQADVCPYCGVA